MQLITHEGDNKGVISRKEALEEARDAGLDLVLLTDSGKDGLPVAKILDYGKLLYEKKKQQAEAKKKQKIIQIKEVKLRPKIADHDFQTKLNRAISFLLDGKRVKFTIMFRGREMTMQHKTGSDLWKKVVTVLEKTDLGGGTLVQEADSKSRNLWSQVFYLKS